MRHTLAVMLMGLLLLAWPAGALAQRGPSVEEADSPRRVAAPTASDVLRAFSAGSAGVGQGINPLEVLAGAGDVLPGVGNGTGTAGGGASNRGGLSTALNIMVVLTVITLVPSIMLMCTCFVRILIVLGLLKQAIGTASVPPPQVITALALFMTLLVMSPTVERIHDEAIVPYRQGTVSSYDQLWEKGKQPVRDFMFDQIEATGNWSSLYMVLDYRGVDTSEPEKLTRAQVDMVSLVPAYMLSELKVAFLMGFRVYLPFLVIDMVVSTMLISMSMMMLPPVLISLPFKMLLFVLVDGWALVVQGLMQSFVTHQGGAGAETAMLLPQMWPEMVNQAGPQAWAVAVQGYATALRGAA